MLNIEQPNLMNIMKPQTKLIIHRLKENLHIVPIILGNDVLTLLLAIVATIIGGIGYIS